MFLKLHPLLGIVCSFLCLYCAYGSGMQHSIDRELSEKIKSAIDEKITLAEVARILEQDEPHQKSFEALLFEEFQAKMPLFLDLTENKKKGILNDPNFLVWLKDRVEGNEALAALILEFVKYHLYKQLQTQPDDIIAVLEADETPFNYSEFLMQNAAQLNGVETQIEHNEEAIDSSTIQPMTPDQTNSVPESSEPDDDSEQTENSDSEVALQQHASLRPVVSLHSINSRYNRAWYCAHQIVTHCFDYVAILRISELYPEKDRLEDALTQLFMASPVAQSITQLIEIIMEIASEIEEDPDQVRTQIRNRLYEILTGKLGQELINEGFLSASNESKNNEAINTTHEVTAAIDQKDQKQEEEISCSCIVAPANSMPKYYYR